MIKVIVNLEYDFVDLEIDEIDRQIDNLKVDLNDLKTEILADLIADRNLTLEQYAEHSIDSILELCRTGR